MSRLRNNGSLVMGVALLAALAAGVLMWHAAWRRAGDRSETAAAATTRAAADPAAPRPRKITRPLKPGPLQDVDVRQPPAASPHGDAVRDAAAAALRQKVPGVQIDFDLVTGGPKNVTVPGRFLASPSGTTKLDHDPNAAVREFLDANRALFGHGAAALEKGGARVTREDVSAHNGMRTTVWQQELDGIPIFQSVLRANVTKNGDIITLGGSFVRDAAAASKLAPKDRAALIAQPAIGVAKAVTLAAADIGTVVDEAAVKSGGAAAGAERTQRLEAPALSDTSAHLTWVPMNADALRLAWDVTTMSTQRGEMFRVLVDAQSGAVLVRLGLTNYISDATFRVYAKPDLQPYDSPTPFAPGHSTPLTTQPPAVSRNAITLQAENATASPNGWINDGVTETLGNNVDAHTDTNADNVADLPRPTSATRNFDFALDLTQAPSTYKNAAVVNLFYVCNWIHDKLYALGFTESAGNFQTNNFGRGGSGNDAVLADAQDGSGTNNANFSTPADGSAGRMQMYVFDGPTPDRDGDLDQEIVIHEYTHGLSNRLVGGGVGMSANQSEGMGEGWSDFYALCLLSEAGDDPNGCYAAGGYATKDFAGLTQNYYFGIRRYPYSTDLLKNPLTFKDIDPAQAGSHSGISRSPIIGSTANEVHNEGEVWCVTLWDMRANLVAKHGWAAGNQLALQLVTDGMKLSPVDPNFLQARDAIIQADLVNNAGANRNELWAAFAKRGMGAGASSPASTTTTGLVESFDLPDDLGVTPAALFLSIGEVGGPFSPASNTYTLTNNGAASLNWTAAVDQPWITLSAASGTLAAGAAITLNATVNSAANSLANGSYPATITLTNTTSGRFLARSVRLRVGQIDYFTELFDTSGPQDTDNQSFTFTPNTTPSAYSVAKDSAPVFPTDPAGGTSLTMSDDTSVLVSLTGGKQVTLYGTNYSSFYVGSNGYVTFGSSDIQWTGTLANHFNMPRVSAFFDDLVPTTGQVTWKQLADRVAVTWQNVTEYGKSNSNSLQIELFFDGRIRITHLGIAATAGLVGLSRGTGTPADFTESDFSAYFNLAIALALPAEATEGDGVLAGQGVVTRSVPLPASLDVTLASADATALAVPATVTIPANAASATFGLTIGDNALLDGSRLIGVTASATGAASANATMTIHDNETAIITLTMPASVTEGDTGATGAVTLSTPADRAVAVLLDSGDKSSINLPASVTVPAGQTAASFPVTVVEDSLIEDAKVVNLTAAVHGWTTGTATTIVQDNEPRVLTVTLPATVLEGAAGMTGSVTASGVLTADLIVDLASDDVSELTVPATVTIPSGQSGATFLLGVVNDPDVDGAQTVHVAASAATYTTGTGTTSVLDDETPAMPANPSPAHLQSNTHPDADLAWSFAAGTGGAPAGYDVYFGTNPAPGVAEFAGSTTAPAWTLPLLSAGTTYYWKIVARKGVASTDGPVWQFSVPVGGPPVRYAWSTVPSPQAVDAPFHVSITGYDVNNMPATAFNGPVDILPATTSSIVITEVNPNTPDAIEFTNVSSSSVDVSGWQIYIYDNTTFPDPLPVFTIPAGSVCAAGQTFKIEEFGAAPGSFPSFFYGTNINWTSSSASTNAVLLRKADGTPVDFMCATAAGAAAITSPAAIPAAQWSGASVSAPPDLNFGYARAGTADTNTAADWITAMPGIGTVNPDLTVPFSGENLVIAPASVTLNTGTWSGDIRVRSPAVAAVLMARDASGNHGETNAFAVNLIGTLSLAGSTTGVLENAGTLPEGFTITLSAPASVDVTVTLGSSIPALIAPVSVVIPAGQTTAHAALSVTDDAVLDGSRTVVISASCPGFLGTSLNVAVNDDETAALSVAAPAQVTEGQGTLAGQGSVTVSAVVGAPVVVTLSSSDASEIIVPASVTIPAGQTSAAFDIVAPQDAIIDGTQSATITAQVTGWTPGTAAITVLDDEPRVLLLNFATSTVEGVGLVSGTVSTGFAVASDLVVDLASNDATEATVPAAVTISAGQSGASFSITVIDDAETDGTQAPIISATAATFSSAMRSLLVRDDDAHHFSFAAVASPQIRNAAIPVVVTARTIDDQVAGAFNATAMLTASSLGGPVPLSPSVTGSFVNGVWSGNASIAAFATGVQITAEAAGGLSGTSGGFDVSFGPLHHFSWSSIASPQYAGVSFPVTITARDSADNIAAGFTGTAGLSTSSSAVFPSVTGSFVAGEWSGDLVLSPTTAATTLTATSGGATGQSGTFAVHAPSPITLTLASSVSESAGTLAGTLSFATARAADAVFTLHSSNPSAIAEPASTVSVPAGQTSATFTLTVVDDAVLDGPQDAVITAGATTFATATANVTVTDNETTAITVTLPAGMTENQGTLPSAGTVTFGAAPVVPVTVHLSSSNPAELSLPASVVIPAGQTSATFDVTLPDDIYIDGPRAVTVTAHVAGWTDGTAAGTVQDDEGNVISITLAFPIQEYAGDVTGTVSVAGVVASAVDVALVSSSSADLTVPAMVTIPAGASSAGFTAHVVQDAVPEPTETVTVSGSALGFIGGSALTFIVDDDPAGFVFSAMPSSVLRTAPQPVTITAVAVGGATVASFSGTAALSASGDGGTVGITPQVTGSFTSGVWTGSVALMNPGTNVRITAAAGGVIGTSDAFAVTELPFDHFTWSTVPSPRYAGVPFPVTLHACDVNGLDVFGFTGPVSLSGISPGAASEIVIGTGTGAVGILLGASNHDVRSQVIHTPAEIGGAGALTSLALYVNTVPGQTLQHWTIRMKHTARANFSADKSWESAGWTVVHQSDQTITSTGWVVFPFTTNFDYNGTDNLLVDYSFNNSSASSNGTVRYTGVSSQRTMYAAADSTAGDPLAWTGTTPAATGSSTVWNVKLLRSPPPLPVTPAVTGAFANGVWSGNVTLASPVASVMLRAADGAAHTGDSGAFEVVPAELVLNAEPPFTGGTSNSLTWPSMGAGIEIEVQEAASAAFPGSASSGWLAPGTASFQFTGLAHGSQHFYRARMRRSGVWTADWSPVVSSTQDGQPPDVSFFTGAQAFTVHETFTLAGAASDSVSGIASLSVNGAPASTADAFSHWEKSLTGLASGSNAFTVTASDHAVPPNTTTLMCAVFRISAPLGDSDGDGTTDLLECAFNLNPTSRDAGAGLPVIDLQAGGDGKKYLTLHYRRRIQPGGFRYSVETSDSLADGAWTGTGGDTLELSAVPTGDGVTEEVTVRVTPATEAAPRKFVRLRVELNY
ncbi:MAG: M36 family metallopeptidase [Verrucomicrobiaceae bacterium]|nr:M36 family metallopeptidase [Verrucomicrobiaceae bacterium]